MVYVQAKILLTKDPINKPHNNNNNKNNFKFNNKISNINNNRLLIINLVESSSL